MPNTIYDSSLITKRLRDKAISESFLNRLQNLNTGSAPLLGITEQSIINYVKEGKMTQYRKNDGGCTTISEGCPCFVPIPISIDGAEPIVSRGWFTHIGGFSEGFSLAVSINNNIYVIGNYNGTPNIYNSDGTSFGDLVNSGNTNVFIVKYNLNGFALWSTRIAGIGVNNGNSLSTDSNNNIVVSGNYSSNPVTIYNSDGTSFGILDNSGNNDVFVVKYNSLGFAQWATRIAGSGTEIGTSISIDYNNNIIVTGYYTSNQIVIYNSDGTSFGNLVNNGLSNIFIVKYNSFGLVQWDTKIGGTNFDVGISISIDYNNNIVVTGYYNSNPVTIYNSDGTSFGDLINNGPSAVYVVKYNSFGFAQWATRIDGIGSDIGRSIITDSNNNIIVTGSYSLNPVTIYNSDGTSFGSLVNSGSTDAFIVKYNSSGFTQWVTRIAGLNEERGNSISIDSNNNIVVTGSYSSNPVTIYNSDGTSFGDLVNSGNTNVFVIKYNSSGFALWATRIAGSGADTSRKILTDFNNNIILTGSYNSSPLTIYDSDGVTFNTMPLEGSDTNTFIVKYNSDGFIIL